MAIGAGSGVASHIGSKIYSGEEITASGILASGIGGAFLKGTSKGFTESLFKNK